MNKWWLWVLAIAAVAAVLMGLNRSTGSSWSLVQTQAVEFDGEEFVCFSNSYGLSCHDVEEEGSESEDETGIEEEFNGGAEEGIIEDPELTEGEAEDEWVQESQSETDSSEHEVEAEWARESGHGTHEDESVYDPPGPGAEA